MSYVVVNSTQNTIIVDFGVFSPLVGYKKANFQKRMISLQLLTDSSYIRVENSQGENWTISYNQSGEALIIQSVDGVAPTSNDHLFTLLTDIMS